MNCHNCTAYNHGAGTKACLQCPKYKDIQKKSVRRKTIRYEIVPQSLLDMFPDEQNDDHKTLLESVKGLPRDMAVLVAMRFYLDLSMQEIADMLQISRQTVSTKIHSALNTLKINISQ